MVFIRLGPQADVLHLDFCLGFSGLAFFLGPFVNELSEVHYTTYGWFGVRRDLDQVELGVAGNLQGFLDGHNPDVITCGPDQADFRDSDAFIYSKIVCADKLLLLSRTDDQPMAGFLREDDTISHCESSTIMKKFTGICPADGYCSAESSIGKKTVW
jgi:hypothetical protein